MQRELPLYENVRRGLFVMLFLLPLVFFPFVYDRYNVVKESTALLLCSLLLCFTGIFLLSAKEVLFKKSPIDAVLLLFIFFSAFALVWSINPYAGLPRVLWWFFLGWVFVFSYRVFKGAESVLRAFFVIVLCGFFVSVYGLFLFFIHKKWMISTLGYPNFMAQYLLFVIPASLGLIFVEDEKLKKYRKFFAACFLLFLYCLILTLVKGAWVGLFVSCALVYNVTQKFFKHETLSREQKGWFALLLLGAFFVMAASNYTVSPTDKRPLTPALEAQSMTDLSSPGIHARLIFYKDTLRIIKDHFFFGVGPENFAVVYPKYRSLKEDIHRYDERLTRVHNDYLQIFAELGVFGFFFFLWVIAVVARRFYFYLKQSGDFTRSEHVLVLCLLSGISATLVQSLFDFNLYNPVSSMYFFFFLGLSFSLFEAGGEGKKEIRETYFVLDKSKAFMAGSAAFLFAFLFLYFPVKTLAREYWKKQGFLAYRDGQYTLARQNLSAAERMDAHDFETVVLVSENEYAKKEYQRALDAVNYALVLSPDNYQLLNFRGRVYFQRREYLNAYKDFEKTIQVYDFSLPHYNLGLLYEMHGDIGNALKEYHISVQRNPSYAQGYYKLGVLYGLAGKHSEALRFFKKAQGGFARNADFHYNLSQALMANGKEKDAVQTLQKAMALSPKNESYTLLYAQWKKLRKEK